MTILTDRLPYLDGLVLGKGKHAAPPNGLVDACLLEAACYIAGERWSDEPKCVSPVLGTFGRNLNDILPDDLRQRLLPFVPRLVGTAGDGQDEGRSYLALDWLVRTYTPTWLRLVPALVSDADALAGFRPITDLESASEIGVMVREAADRARTAGAAAAWAAAGAAARDAAWAAARDAAGAALSPTVLGLQTSAITLLDRMIDPAGAA